MSEQAQPKSRWGAGFLWGCLTPIILIFVAIAALIAAGFYYFVYGYKHDSTFQAVLATVQHNATAHSVLGNNIDVAGFPSSNIRIDATGETARYDFGVHGSKGDAAIRADCSVVHGHVDIKTLILTVPSGRVYYLIGTSGAPNTNTTWLLSLPRREPHPIPKIPT